MGKHIDLSLYSQVPSFDQIRKFKAFLLPSFRGPIFKGLPWKEIPKTKTPWLTDNHVRGHLQGRHILGYPGKVYTKFVAVDVDRHHDESDSVIFAQAERVISLFPDAQPVVIQSSVSGGIHIYFFFAQAGWSNRAHSFVSGILKAEGLQLEVYPAGTKNFRLPFGAGSVLLDPVDFVPLHSSNVESFKAFLWAIENGKIEPLEIPVEFRAHQTPFKTPRKTSHKPRKIDLSESTSPFMLDIDTLLSDGLRFVGGNFNAFPPTNRRTGINNSGF